MLNKDSGRQPRGGPAPGKSDYPAELARVLKSRDGEKLRTFLAASARRFGNEAQAVEVESRDDDEMQELLHRMTLARPDLDSLHAGSQAWLEKAGRGEDVLKDERPRRPAASPPTRPKRTRPS